MKWRRMSELVRVQGQPILAALRYRDGEPAGVHTIYWREDRMEWVFSCMPSIGLASNAKDDENLDPIAWMPAPKEPSEEPVPEEWEVT